MQNFDVIIIGAGAAGLMCAIEAGKRGRKVCILDHANKPGKKILMSGGGRCNFTNLYISPDKYLSQNPHFVKSALSRYTQWDFIDWIEAQRIPYHEKCQGQLFCSNKAKDILNLLLDACSTNQVKIFLNESVQEIQQQLNNHFHLKTDKRTYTTQSLVVATGGLSIPTLGASPFGYKVAEQFGIKVHPTRAGLVPFTLHVQDKQNYSNLSGISHHVALACKNTQFIDDLLFTHRGISGPAALQISSFWQPGDSLNIDFYPNQDFINMLSKAIACNPEIALKSFLKRTLSKRLLESFITDELLSMKLKSLNSMHIEQIKLSLQNIELKPNATEGYRTAEVTLGGVDCDSISSKTMESRTVKNLFFIGEVLDVAGWLGGYNFQWAWSSGWAAGQVV